MAEDYALACGWINVKSLLSEIFGRGWSSCAVCLVSKLVKSISVHCFSSQPRRRSSRFDYNLAGKLRTTLCHIVYLAGWLMG